MRRFERGSTVLLREVLRGEVWAAKPLVCVEDSPERVVLWLASGTAIKLPDRHGKAPAWTLVDDVWTGDCLMVMPAGAAHAVLLIWPPGRDALRCFYVNLQAPLQRTDLGFDFLDHDLDVVIAPDLSSWTWKDEEDLASAVQSGVFSPAEAAAIRAEGERVLAQLASGEWPYVEWLGWSPDPAWAVPSLPARWDVVDLEELVDR